MILPWRLLVVAGALLVAASVSDTNIDANEGHSVCHEGDDGNQCGQNLAETISCDAEVLLFDGVPNLPIEDNTITGQPRATTLLQKQPAVFDKVSRFGESVIQEETLRANNVFHISANGDHLGWYVYVPNDRCLWEAKRLVAREIVALLGDNQADDMVKFIDRRGPHRLVDEEGRAYPHGSISPRLHVLLPRESFVHEAVEEGFVRTLSGGISLTTLSMSPRVFVVDPILTVDECNEIIEASSNRFHRSGEKHYAPGYENYRTSLSAQTPRSSKVAQKLWQRVINITAVPKEGVEFPQLLKYETHVSWYKAHMDYFHTYDDKPLEDLRVFLETRSRELIRLGEKEISGILDANSYQDFDNIERSLDRRIIAPIATELGLSRQDGIADERHLVHSFLRQSVDPVRDFSRVAVRLAAQLLEVNGATHDLASDLAEKHFRFNETPARVEDYVPFFVKAVEFNRFVTVLPIFATAEKGGHTAFPHSTSTLGIAAAAGETIEECRNGLIVKPSAGQALMFYNRKTRGDKDPESQHAGCSLQEGVKYAANCFTWDTNQAWTWRFFMTVEELYR